MWFVEPLCSGIVELITASTSLIGVGCVTAAIGTRGHVMLFHGTCSQTSLRFRDGFADRFLSEASP